MSGMGIGSRVFFCGLVLGLSLTASAENYDGDGKLAFVNAGKDIYVREEPSVNSRAVAILGDNAYVRMYDTTKDGWVAIRSGEATGYVKKERLISGKAAKKMANKVGQEIGIVYPEALKIREAMNLDAEALDLVYKDENLRILERDGDWLKVEAPSGVIGYVHSMYCNYATVYETASLIEPKETPWKKEEKKPLVGCQAWRAPEDDNISWQKELGVEDVDKVLIEETQIEAEEETEAQSSKDSSKKSNKKKKKQVEVSEKETEKTVVEETESVEEPQWQPDGYVEEPQWQPDSYVEEPQWQPDSYVEEPQWQPDSYVEEPQWQPDSYVEEPQWQPDGYVEEPQWQPDSYVEEPQWQPDSYIDEPQSQPENNSEGSQSQRNGNINGQDLVNYGMQFVGNPYVWGGTDLVYGADCSGFTQSVYANFGVQIPRVAADQMTLGYQVPLEEAQVGDLVFYDQEGAGVDHVGVYAGNGLLLHASSPEVGIIVSDMYSIGSGPVGIVSYDYSGYLY